MNIAEVKSFILTYIFIRYVEKQRGSELFPFLPLGNQLEPN